MKQTRKNQTKLVLNMPTTSYYTLEELFALNKHFNAEITIRVRHTNLIESGKVKEIGCLTGGKGRPSKVFAATPVTQLTLDKARQNEINLVENVNKLINVISVTPSPIVKVTSGIMSSSSVLN